MTLVEQRSQPLWLYKDRSQWPIALPHNKALLGIGYSSLQELAGE